MVDNTPIQYTPDQDWTWSQSPFPGDPVLVLFVNTSDIIVDNPGVVGNMPKREIQALGAIPYSPPTAFKDLDPKFAFPSLSSCGVDNWLFTGAREVNAQKTAFYFFRDKTPAEMAIPYDTEYVEGAHHWDTVVLDVWAETDYSMPLSANTIDIDASGIARSGIIIAPTIRIRSLEIPQIEEGSTIITRKYLSATQPKLAYHRVPQPMNMDVQVNGASRFFERTLHDTITVSATLSGTRQILSNGAASDVGGVVGSQTFEATNFIERKPYFRSDAPIRDETYGFWVRTSEEVIPPKILPVVV